MHAIKTVAVQSTSVLEVQSLGFMGVASPHLCLQGRASSLRRGTRPDDVTCYDYSSTTHHDSLDLSPSSTAALDLSSWFTTYRRMLLPCLTYHHGSRPTVVFCFGIRPLVTALDLLSSLVVAFTITIALDMHHQHPSTVTRAHIVDIHGFGVELHMLPV